MRSKWMIAILCVWIVPSAAKAMDPGTIRLGTSTSIRSSGLLDMIQPEFEKDTGYKLQILAVGSGRALQLARLGEVDLLLVHAPSTEKRFIEQGLGHKRIEVLRNYFMLVGPRADPAQINGLTHAVAAFKKIADSNSLFVSRADDSGTHKKELFIWKAAGIEPVGGWYFETGQGMGKTLKLADEKQAYTLVDSATWLHAADQLSLEVMLNKNTELENIYSFILLNREKQPGLNFQGAEAFVRWFQSSKARQLIAAMQINRQRFYYFMDEQ